MSEAVGASLDEREIGARCSRCNEWSRYQDWRNASRAQRSEKGERPPRRRDPREHKEKKEADERPVISCSPELSEMVDALEWAVADADDQAGLYHRGNLIVRVLRGSKPPKGVKREVDAPSISIAPRSHLLEIASRVARWERYDGRSHRWVHRMPIKEAIEAFADRGAWPRLRELRGVTETPVLRQDGTVLGTPGWDTLTGLLFDPIACDFPEIPEHPTRDEAVEALKLLLDVFADFPFKALHDQSAAIAAVLTLLARPACATVPMFTVSAPTAGTGKSLLIDVIAGITTGRTAARMTQEAREEEKKLILSLAIEGALFVLIDNVEKPLGSDVLASTLTAPTVGGRLLGENKSVTAPQNMTFFASGNNLQVRGDLARRCFPIELDARTEQPEERSGFRLRLPQDALDRRGELVAAGLTILRGFVCAGRPIDGLSPIGSYAAWNELVRAACIWVGLEDPALGRRLLRDRGDVERETITVALSEWHSRIGEAPVTVAELIRDAAEADEFLDALTALDWKAREGKPDPKRLGHALRRNADRIVDGLRLERVESDRSTKVAVWRVVRA